MATNLDTPMSTERRAAVENISSDIELCCPGCGGFVAGIELPEHRVEQNVVFMVRLNCRRCKKRSKRRVTFQAGRHA